MIKIIKYELLKIFTSKLFLYTFLAFVVTDIAILSYTYNIENKNQIPYHSYKLLNQEIENLTEDEKKELINREYDKILAFSIINSIKISKSSNDEGERIYGESLKEENQKLYDKYINLYENANFKYTGDIGKELDFLEKIKLEYEETENYKKNINDILEKAKDLEEISIFKNNQDDFSKKNIKDTAKVYENMKDIKINYQVSKGISTFTEMSLTDVFIILLIFVISSVIVFEEREKNLFTIIKCTKNGRTKTILSKIIVTIMSIIVITLIFYGIRYIFYGITIGYGDLRSKFTINKYLYIFYIKGKYSRIFITIFNYKDNCFFYYIINYFIHFYIH